MRLAPPVFATHRPGPWLVPDPNIAASILALCQRGKRSMVRLPIATAALRSAAVQPAYRRFTPPHRAKLTLEQHLMPREAVTFAQPLRHHVTKPRLWPAYLIGCRDCSNVRGLQPNGQNQRPVEHRGAANVVQIFTQSPATSLRKGWSLADFTRVKLGLACLPQQALSRGRCIGEMGRPSRMPPSRRVSARPAGTRLQDDLIPLLLSRVVGKA